MGEAEYAAVVSGSAEGLGLQALMKDLGWNSRITIKTDSSVAQAVSQRRGLGRLRHVDVRLLWVQEAVKKGRLKLQKVDGATNVADHLTKEPAIKDYADIIKGVGGCIQTRATP